VAQDRFQHRALVLGMLNELNNKRGISWPVKYEGGW
jgi:hypothetical protein